MLCTSGLARTPAERSPSLSAFSLAPALELKHGHARVDIAAGLADRDAGVAFGTGQDSLAFGRFGPTRFQQGASYRMVCYRTDSAARVIYKGSSNVGPTQGSRKVGREGTPGFFHARTRQAHGGWHRSQHLGPVLTDSHSDVTSARSAGSAGCLQAHISSGLPMKLQRQKK